jgi:hypothetical protein
MALKPEPGAGPGVGPDDVTPVSMDAPGNEPGELIVSRTAVAEPIVVSNTLGDRSTRTPTRAASSRMSPISASSRNRASAGATTPAGPAPSR